jgi:hypothetical protein
MANTTITNLPLATSINGTEQIPAVQSSSTVRLTVNQVAAYTAAAGFPSLPATILSLPAATTPLSGAELVPLSQGGVTKQATVASVASKLIGALTYYVRTDGSNSNNGLSNSSGGAFLTLQKAIDVLAGVNLNQQTVTIRVADGTYTGGVSVNTAFINPPSTGVIVEGNVSTPANVLLNLTSQNGFQVTNGAILTIKGFKITVATAGSAFYIAQRGVVYWTNVDFGAVPSFHMDVFQDGFAQSIGNYSISGGAVGHMHAMQGGKILNNLNTVTITGTPAFSSFFIGVAGPGTAQCIGQTYVGSATGQRFLVHNNGFIDLGNSGGSITYFPGNVAGVTQAYGVYDYKTYGSLALGGSFSCSCASLISPFQFLVSANLGIRSAVNGSAATIDATNAAQSSYAPIEIGATSISLNANGGAITVSSLTNAVNDAAAAAAGVAVNQLYRNGSVIQVRVV